MRVYLFALGVCILTAIVFMTVRVRGDERAALYLKLSASLMFVFTGAAALYERAASGAVYGPLILCGLVCGLLGDAAMDLRRVYPADRDMHLYWGFGFFGAGHMLYIFAMIFTFDMSNGALVAAAGAALVVAAGIFFSPKITGMDMGRFRAVSAGYAFVLTLAAGTAVGAFILDPTQTAALIMGIAGILFMISDFVLSFSIFGKSKPLLTVVCHVAYYAAQLLIASSILYA